MSRTADPIAAIRRRIARPLSVRAPVQMPPIATLIDRIDHALSERRAT